VDRFVALLFSGITDGAVVALAAVGLLVLHKATGIINFAHGDLITLGAFVDVWLVTDHGWSYPAGTLATVVLMVAVGAAMERVVVAPLRGRSVHVVVIATLGIALALRAVIANWQGGAPRRLASPASSGSTDVFGATINHHRFLVVVIAAGVLALAVWVFARTPWGRQLRALAADRDTARLVGIRAGFLSMGAFGASAALAGLCGTLIAPLSAAELTLGFGVMLSAFGAMVIGGFGSIGGVVLAGLLIGIVERLVGGYVLEDYRSALPFLVMIAAIAVRPEGFFGARHHEVRV
jgi:branched-chain amino acid transport system permease protein